MKRIERSIVEAIKHFDKNDWEMCPYTVKMIKDSDKIKDFYHYYEDIEKEKLDKIVNFFWEKEYEIGQFGKFWDDEKDIGYYGYLVKTENFRFYKGSKNYRKNDVIFCFRNFEPITEIPKYEGEK